MVWGLRAALRIPQTVPSPGECSNRLLRTWLQLLGSFAHPGAGVLLPLRARTTMTPGQCHARCGAGMR